MYVLFKSLVLFFFFFRTNYRSFKKGVIYFGDDDNVYDWKLFEEMRHIERAGVWPVGIVGGLIAETPIISPNGSITGFTSVWKPDRPFPIDMAGFAVNLSLVVENPSASLTFDVPRGYQVGRIL